MQISQIISCLKGGVPREDYQYRTVLFRLRRRKGFPSQPRKPAKIVLSRQRPSQCLQTNRWNLRLSFLLRPLPHINRTPKPSLPPFPLVNYHPGLYRKICSPLPQSRPPHGHHCEIKTSQTISWTIGWAGVVCLMPDQIG